MEELILDYLKIHGTLSVIENSPEYKPANNLIKKRLVKKSLGGLKRGVIHITIMDVDLYKKQVQERNNKINIALAKLTNEEKELLRIKEKQLYWKE